MSVTDAIETLKAAGAVFVLPDQSRHFSLRSAAEKLDCSVKYLREHLAEFPNAWRLSGGELRIPASDIEAWIKARRVFEK
jgi:predicted DNA-binding transcriptional regulator AlpA